MIEINKKVVDIFFSQDSGKKRVWVSRVEDVNLAAASIFKKEEEERMWTGNYINIRTHIFLKNFNITYLYFKISNYIFLLKKKYKNSHICPIKLYHISNILKK